MQKDTGTTQLLCSPSRQCPVFFFISTAAHHTFFILTIYLWAPQPPFSLPAVIALLFISSFDFMENNTNRTVSKITCKIEGKYNLITLNLQHFNSYWFYSNSYLMEIWLNSHSLNNTPPPSCHSLFPPHCPLLSALNKYELTCITVYFTALQT